jgi:hypothetical protein
MAVWRARRLIDFKECRGNLEKGVAGQQAERDGGACDMITRMSMTENE